MDLGQAQRVLLECLTKTIDPQHQRAGEVELQTLSKQPGFGVVVSALLTNEQVNSNYRQLAGVVLRQYVEKSWDPDSKSFEGPVASDDDKNSIRNVLPNLLGDNNSKVQTAACMAMAAIGSVDWPGKWPNLVEILIAAISSDNPQTVIGGLKCLALFAEDITDHQLTQTIPILYPALLKTIGNNKYPMASQRRAVAVYRTCTQSLYTVTGGGEDMDSDDEDGLGFWRLVQKLLHPTLPQWLTVFQQVLEPKNIQADHSLALEVIKTLTTICTLFPRLLEQQIPAFMPLVWTLLSEGYERYSTAVIQGQDDGVNEAYDEEGDAMGLSAFVCEIFEFFAQMPKMPPNVQKCLEGPMPDLINAAIRYMQMTQTDVQSWEDDPNEFVAFEEDAFLQAYSVRVSAHSLITMFLDAYAEEGALLHTLQAAQKCLEEANRNKMAGNPEYWKLQESAMFALGFVADELGPMANKGQYDCSGLIQSAIIPELQHYPNQAVYIRARAIWCVSHFTPIFAQNGGASPLTETVLNASVAGLQTTELLPVRMAASKAIGMLSSVLDKTQVTAFIPTVLPLMCELLSHASAETLHCCLDTLCLIVDVNKEATATMHADLVPLLLTTWGKNAADHLVTQGIVEVIESMANIAHCCKGVQERTLPTIMQVLGAPQQHYSGTVEAALDLLCVLVKASENLKLELHPIFTQQALPLVLTNVLNTDDNSVLESGTITLTAYVRVVGAKLSAAVVDGTSILQILCKTVAKLLSPELSDNSAYAVGGLVTQMVFKLQESLGQENIAHLIRAVIIRLYSAQMPDTVEGLLLLFARLFHAHGLEILSFLQGCGQLPVKEKVADDPSTYANPNDPYPRITYSFVDKQINALEFVLQKWVAGQVDFHAPYPTKVSLTALLRLLENANEVVANIAVDGYPEVSKSSRRTTRSQARGKAPLTYTKIPLASKIIALAVQEWKEQKESRELKESGGDGGDDEDEGGFCMKKPEGMASPFADADDYKHLQLSDLIGMYGEEDDEDLQEEMYPESKTDPLNLIDLETHLRQTLVSFAQQQQQKAQTFVAHLSPEDQQTFNQLLA